jgi:hypothetical protein
MSYSSVFAYSIVPEIRYFNYQYIESKDVYKGVYGFNGFANKIRFEFWTPTNVYYTHTETYSGGLTGVVWLLCNGTYDLTIYNGSTFVGKIENIITTELNEQPCMSSADYNTVKDYFDDGDTGGDFNANGSILNGGNKRISYDRLNGATDYDLFKWNENSTDWGTPIQTNDGNNDYFDITEDGYYKIVARDEFGNIINYDYIDNDQFKYNTENNNCNGCKTLNEMLACPAWDQYMNEFGEMISGAIPAPPDMNLSMDYLIDQLAEQEVTPIEPVAPAPFEPDYPEQEIDLPEPIETDLEPDPNAFPIETGGEGSGAVIVTDPTEWTPDNTDIGYNPPNPDSDNAPDYEPPTTEPETPPDYNAPGGDSDTPPDYNPPSTVTDEIPDYNAGNEESDTPPDYNAGNENNNDDVPNYNYQ